LIAPGCGESVLHSTLVDQPYMAVNEPKLVLKEEHFGGGYKLPDGRKTFFAGGKLSNCGLEDALNVRMKVRMKDGNGPSQDMEIFLGDVKAHEEVEFNKAYFVTTLEKLDEVIMTYQFGGRIFTFPLDTTTEFIEDYDKREY
jgi:hypothetical protein